MRILVLSIYFIPEVGANSRLASGLALELREIGHDVTVLTDLPHYPDGVIPTDYRGRLLMREQVQGMEIIRSWLLVGSRGSKWRRIANNLTFAASATVSGMLARKPDVLYIYSPPLFLGITGYLLGRLKRIPFVLNVQDIYPEIAVKHGIVTNPTIISMLERLERWIYRNASHITVISEGFKQNLIAKGVSSDKVSVIPNWVETELFSPRPKDNGFSREHGLCERFIVMYAGNMGHSQGLENVLEAARLLQDNEHILFVLVGDGVKRADLLSLREAYQLENVRFLPYQPRERMPEVIASADANLVILQPEKSRTTIQSKTYEIMAMERPIIAAVDPDGDNWRLVERAHAGIWCTPVAGDSRLRRELGRMGRQYVERHNGARSAAEHYARLFEELVKTT
jgi:colanic acid biosynthesis glycosyl transferase WcaI